MIDSQVQTELLQALRHLPLVQQQCVLEYAKVLNSLPDTTENELPKPNLELLLQSARQQLANRVPESEPIRGGSFESIQHLIGSLPDDLADEMLQAIEQHCERIDPDE